LVQRVKSGTTLFCLFVLALAFPAHAQVKIAYTSSHAKAGQPVPSECIEAGKSLVTQLNRFPRPDNWTFIIACDAKAWSNLKADAGLSFNGLDVYGATNLKNSTTLLSGDTLRGKDASVLTPEHLVAHELAHIVLKNYTIRADNEQQVESLAQGWLSRKTSTQEGQ